MSYKADTHIEEYKVRVQMIQCGPGPNRLAGHVNRMLDGAC